MYRTLGEWGRKCIGHWVNGVEQERTVMSRNRVVSVKGWQM